MVILIENHDPEFILSFMQGEGIKRRCFGGYDLSGVDLKAGIESSKAIFLIAYDDSVPKGFVMLNPEGNKVFSIHLCLRTIGAKTREVFSKALGYAKEVLGAVEIKAYYPSSYRAVKQLLSFFGFTKDEFSAETPVPYSFEKLSLI